MNKEGTNIFLSSAQAGTPSSYSVRIPMTTLDANSEVALTEILLPKEYVPEQEHVFTMQKIFQNEGTDYLKLKLHRYRTVKELADHLNNQIHEVVKMRFNVINVAHVIFSVGDSGCLVTKGSKIDALIDDVWLGFLDDGRGTAFGTLLGFSEQQSHSLFSTSPRLTHEAYNLPIVVETPFLLIQTNLVPGEPLRKIESGKRHIIFKDRVHKPVAPDQYIGINITVLDGVTKQPVKFERGTSVCVLNLRENTIIDG